MCLHTWPTKQRLTRTLCAVIQCQCFEPHDLSLMRVCWILLNNRLIYNQHYWAGQTLSTVTFMLTGEYALAETRHTLSSIFHTRHTLSSIFHTLSSIFQHVHCLEEQGHLVTPVWTHRLCLKSSISWNRALFKGIVHFEIHFLYVLAFLKGIQDR